MTLVYFVLRSVSPQHRKPSKGQTGRSGHHAGRVYFARLGDQMTEILYRAVPLTPGTGRTVFGIVAPTTRWPKSVTVACRTGNASITGPSLVQSASAGAKYGCSPCMTYESCPSARQLNCGSNRTDYTPPSRSRLPATARTPWSWSEPVLRWLFGRIRVDQATPGRRRFGAHRGGAAGGLVDRLAELPRRDRRGVRSHHDGLVITRSIASPADSVYSTLKGKTMKTTDIEGLVVEIQQDRDQAQETCNAPRAT